MFLEQQIIILESFLKDQETAVMMPFLFSDKVASSAVCRGSVRSVNTKAWY